MRGKKITKREDEERREEAQAGSRQPGGDTYTLMEESRDSSGIT